MSIVNYPFSNQLTPLPLNDDTDVSVGNWVSVLDSEVSTVLGVLGVARKERVVWLQMRYKKRHKSPFFSNKTIEKSQPPAFQYPFVLHPIRIIQHPWELIPFTCWVTRLPLRWYDRSNSSRIYIGLKSVLNWGQQTFRHWNSDTNI